jgi:hypothetical protein
MSDFPWPINGQIDKDRECGRCGETIPANWRHFWEPCSCTYLPVGRRPHLPDPACRKCGGSGYLPCRPQDLSILRCRGYCSECGETAFVLIRTVAPVGEIEGSARHFDPRIDGHDVVKVAAGPLVKTVGDYLDIEARRNDPESIWMSESIWMEVDPADAGDQGTTDTIGPS